MNILSQSVELPGEDYTLNIDEIIFGKFGDDDRTAFAGFMQNFYFDGRRLFDNLNSDNPGWSVDKTVSPSDTEIDIPMFSVTFRRNTNVQLPVPQTADDTNIRFMFKTTDKDGLLLYNAGSPTDFLAVELVNGILHVSSNDGGGPVYVTGSTAGLADNEWHMIDIQHQSRPRKLTTKLDGRIDSTLSFVPSRNTFDMRGTLYVGGIPGSIRLPAGINSKSYTGCLATLNVNGRLQNLPLLGTSVTPGCSGNMAGLCCIVI